MSLAKLSIMNFKASFKNYVSLIISLAFTVLIIFNFFNLMDSSIMESLGKINSQNIKIVIQCVIVVLSCFMFFFIWYATNVFLTKRKKEIGVYVFMGLTNQRIGKLYMLETMLIGLVALVMGIGFGILISQLFTMTLVTISDIEVNLSFEISLSAILWSSLIYFIVYMIFVFKGYINLVRSSVLDMVSANRQNEYVKQNKVILFLKAILGIIILVLGYYYAIKEGGMETMANALLAVILVIIGVYLLFGGFIPLIYQTLASNKRFLYKKQRTLWINQIIFRMKKNYRTYAIVTVLMICALTALATGVAMHERCQMIHDFENVYTYQIFSQQANLQNEFMQVIEEHNDVQYSSYIEMLQIEGSYASTTHQKNTFALIPYSQLKKLAQDSHQAFELKQPQNDEVIDLAHQYILSLITTDELEDIQKQMRIFRHDYQNQMSSLYLSSQKGDIENVEKSLKTMINDFDEHIGKKMNITNQLANIQIPEVKSLLMKKMTEMQKSNISVKLEVLYPFSKINMPVFDFIRCLGILIDNAMEEVKENNGKIHFVFFAATNGQLTMTISNTIRREIDCEKIFQEGYSTKGNNRGMGLSILQEMIHHSENVTMETRVENNEFIQEITIC